MEKRRNLLSFTIVALLLVLSNCNGINRDKDSKMIKSVKIGYYEWMARNLNVSTFQNGDIIPEAKSAEEWIDACKIGKPVWCYYNNDPVIGEKYGKLYNWYAMKDPRGLAPKGWQIPSDIEWTYLDNYIYNNGIIGFIDSSDWKQNGVGINASGFSALLGGRRSDDGDFEDLGEKSYWWTEFDGPRYTHRNMNLIGMGSGSRKGPSFEGMYIRCIKTKIEDINKDNPNKTIKHKDGNLTGVWKSKDISLTITKEGDNYLIKCKNPNGMVGGTYYGPYEDGIIKIGGAYGDITYSKERDKLYFAGDELSRIN